MKRLSAFGVTLVLGVVGCATGPSEPAMPVSAPLGPVAYADPPVGRQLIRTAENGGNLTWTVVAVEPGIVHLTTDRGGEVEAVTPFLAARRWSLESTSGDVVVEGDPRAFFPLTVGKEGRWKLVGIMNDRQTEFSVHCTVAGEERVEVAAGSFDTYKIVCLNGGDPNLFYRTNTFYFAPSVNDYVKEVVRTRDRRGERDTELVALVDPG